MNNHRIPNEFSRSDKLGPFTMTQAGILGGGALLFLVLVLTIKNFIILAFGTIVLVCIISALMFVNVNKMPVYEFIFKYTMYSFSPRLLVFRSDNTKNNEFEDELIGFQERIIAENTVKNIKKDGKKKKQTKVTSQKVNANTENKKKVSKSSNKNLKNKKKGGNNWK